MMAAGKVLAGAQLGKHGFHIGNRALHPFKLRVQESPALQGFAHGVIGDDTAIVSLCTFIQFDGVIGDGGSFKGSVALRNIP